MTKESPEETVARLDTHEAVCAERYNQMNMRLSRMEGWFAAGAGAIILLLLGVLTSVLVKK